MQKSAQAGASNAAYKPLYAMMETMENRGRDGGRDGQNGIKEKPGYLIISQHTFSYAKISINRELTVAGVYWVEHACLSSRPLKKINVKR